MRKVTISIRELQQNLKRVLARVEQGQVIEVTRRHRPVARLTPLLPAKPASPWPNLEARTRSIFGDRTVTPKGSEVVTEARGKR